MLRRSTHLNDFIVCTTRAKDTRRHIDGNPHALSGYLKEATKLVPLKNANDHLDNNEKYHFPICGSYSTFIQKDNVRSSSSSMNSYCIIPQHQKSASVLYLMANYISYHKYFPTYKAFLSTITSHVKPKHLS